ncbi:DegT/DnrJ/EryC1/StrS family aminotransferase [Caulobacter segnis]
MHWTLLPKHSPAMRPLDFAQAARRASNPNAHLQALWGERLPGKRVFGMPAGRHALWAFPRRGQDPARRRGDRRGLQLLCDCPSACAVGLRPVFVDIDPATLSLDADAVARAVNETTRLVLVTHMFGASADLDAILAICRPRGVKVFEDCAHAVGSHDRYGQLGARGDGALFSFGPQKLVNCFGGGMLALDETLAEGWTPPPPPKVSWTVAASTPAKALLSVCMAPSLYRWTLRPLISLGRFLAACGMPWLRDLASPSKDLAGYRLRPGLAAALRAVHAVPLRTPASAPGRQYRGAADGGGADQGRPPRIWVPTSSWMRTATVTPTARTSGCWSTTPLASPAPCSGPASRSSRSEFHRLRQPAAIRPPSRRSVRALDWPTTTWFACPAIHSLPGGGWIGSSGRCSAMRGAPSPSSRRPRHADPDQVQLRPAGGGARQSPHPPGPDAQRRDPGGAGDLVGPGAACWPGPRRSWFWFRCWRCLCCWTPWSGPVARLSGKGEQDRRLSGRALVTACRTARSAWRRRRPRATGSSISPSLWGRVSSATPRRGPRWRRRSATRPGLDLMERTERCAVLLVSAFAYGLFPDWAAAGLDVRWIGRWLCWRR